MAGRIILQPTNPSLDPNGKPVNGAQLYFYQNKTTTPQSVFTDSTLATPLANPLPSDAAGRFPEIWIADKTGYSVKWVRTGETNITYDDIFASGLSDLNTMFHAELVSAPENIATPGAWQKVNLDTVIFDNASGWSAVHHWWVVPFTGKYRLSAQISVTGNLTAGSNLFVSISKNGLTGASAGEFSNPHLTVGGASVTDATNVSIVTSLSAGDTIELDANVNGTALVLSNSPSSAPANWLTIEWVGP